MPPRGRSAVAPSGVVFCEVGSPNATRVIPTVNTPSNEIDPVLSQDGCELYFASDRDADGHYHLFHAAVVK